MSFYKWEMVYGTFVVWEAVKQIGCLKHFRPGSGSVSRVLTELSDSVLRLIFHILRVLCASVF